MGQLSLKQLVELTGYADSKFESEPGDFYGSGRKNEKISGSLTQDMEDTKKQDMSDAFSHRRALRVV